MLRCLSTVVDSEAVVALAPGQRFSRRTVFLTGAGHGMGLATASAFAREGARVFIYDLDTGRVEQAVARLRADGLVAAGMDGDVRDRARIDAALDACEVDLGPVDVLVNHAGIGPSQHTFDIDEAAWDEVIGINLTGVFRVGQSVARRMVRRGSGVILNMSSSGAIAGEPGHAHYAASKAGILALTRAMAKDLGPHGLRVCALCPGDIDTYEWGNVELARLYRSKIPLGRSGRPEEVAAVYLYLASDDAANLNGVAFIVDGGMLAWE